MTLYPYFVTNPAGILKDTVISNKVMSRNNSTTTYSVEYAKGSASPSSLSIMDDTSTSTTSYTHDG
jgi:hypothetical protein